MAQKVAPKDGVTVFAHVDQTLANATAVLIAVARTIREGKRLRPALRENLWRDLAGVQADTETVKRWLDAGAPR